MCRLRKSKRGQRKIQCEEIFRLWYWWMKTTKNSPGFLGKWWVTRLPFCPLFLWLRRSLCRLFFFFSLFLSSVASREKKFFSKVDAWRPQSRWSTCGHFFFSSLSEKRKSLSFHHRLSRWGSPWNMPVGFFLPGVCSVCMCIAVWRDVLAASKAFMKSLLDSKEGIRAIKVTKWSTVSTDS